MAWYSNIASNKAVNRFTAVGLQGQAALRVGGGAALGAAAGYEAGDRPYAGAALGALAGGAGHYAMNGRSVFGSVMGAARRMKPGEMQNAVRAVGRRIPLVF